MYTHVHPFTVGEAAALDVGTIVGEINRLRNSLAHLDTSQAELTSFLDEEEDPDLRAAWAENEDVIAAQRERIELLRDALATKVGVDSLAHYGIDQNTQINGPGNGPALTSASAPDASAAILVSQASPAPPSVPPVAPPMQSQVSTQASPEIVLQSVESGDADPNAADGDGGLYL